MSVAWLANVWEHSKATSNELLILLAIADFADKEGKAFPSLKVLAEKSRISVREARYCLRHLVEMGELKVTAQNRENGSQCANAYLIVLPPAQYAPSPLHTLAPPPARTCTTPLQVPAPLYEPSSEPSKEPSKNRNVGDTVDNLRSPKHPTVDVSGDEAFISELREAFPHVDVETEFRKMRLWQQTPRGKGKVLTRQRVLNWCGRCDKPVELNGGRHKESPEDYELMKKLGAI